MRYKSHFVGGILATALSYQSISAQFDFNDSFLAGSLFVAGSLLGSFLPDIDEENTFISNRVKIPFHFFLRHRGILHYPLITGAFLFLIYSTISVMGLSIVSYFLLPFIIGLAIGMFSHYILDTPEGVRWLFPIIRRNMLKVTPSKYRKTLKKMVLDTAFDVSFFCILFILIKNYI